MAELTFTVSKDGQVYFKKQLREMLEIYEEGIEDKESDKPTEAKVVLNACSAVIFPKDAPYEDVIESIDILRKDLENRNKIKSRNKNNNENPTD